MVPSSAGPCQASCAIRSELSSSAKDHGHPDVLSLLECVHRPPPSPCSLPQDKTGKGCSPGHSLGQTWEAGTPGSLSQSQIVFLFSPASGALVFCCWVSGILRLLSPPCRRSGSHVVLSICIPHPAGINALVRNTGSCPWLTRLRPQHLTVTEAPTPDWSFVPSCAPGPSSTLQLPGWAHKV